MKILLTGRPGIGKTTVVTRTIEQLSTFGIKTGGMISREVRRGSGRVGFEIEDIATRNKGWLARVDLTSGPSVGKYRVHLEDLKNIGVAAIRSALDDESFHLVVIDEIGPMELHSTDFRITIEAALRSPKHLLATVHKYSSDRVLEDARSSLSTDLVEVTEENRRELPARLAGWLTSPSSRATRL